MKPQLHCPVLSVFATKYALTDKHVQRLVSFLNSRKISNMIPELVRRMGAPIVRTPYVRILEVIQEQKIKQFWKKVCVWFHV